MTAKRRTVSLPEDADNTLQNLATDCGMDASQCVTQLIRRHSGDIRNLFAVDVSNRMQTYADVQPTLSKLHTSAYEESPKSAQVEPIEEKKSALEAVFEMDFD